MTFTRRGVFAAVASLAASVAIVNDAPATVRALSKDLPTDPTARLVRLKWLWRRQVVNEWDISNYPQSMSFAGDGDGHKFWSSGHWPRPEEVRVYEHQMVLGEGATAIEAIDDWYSKMPRGSWYGMVWRVKPELESERDFDTKQTRWAVYSRFALIPHG